MKTLLKAYCFAVLLTGGVSAAELNDEDIDDGMPFGPMIDSDVSNLVSFAQREGVDINGKMQMAYENGNTNALVSVFTLSLKFKDLDQNARAYGQVIYSAFLNLGESGRIDFSAVMARQPDAVRQRIRDFLYYAFLKSTPASKRDAALKDTRKDFPLLFPDGYTFGKNDPIFPKQLLDSQPIVRGDRVKPPPQR